VPRTASSSFSTAQSSSLPAGARPLIDAQEVARLTGRTREWVYDHQGELGAIRLGSGPKPRLGFDPARVLAHMDRADDPTPVTVPAAANPSRRRQRAGRTAAGAELLRVRGHES
jgi:predicted DNA-binding transcriptional regulator AlpA